MRHTAGLAIRILLLAALGFMVALSVLGKHTADGTDQELFADIRRGEVSAVEYDRVGSRLLVRWQDSLLSWKEAQFGRYGPPDDIVEEFRQRVREAAPEGGSVSVSGYWSAHGQGRLDPFIMVGNVLYIPWPAARWGTVAVGFLLIGAMLSRHGTTMRTRARWVLFSLVTGFGFFAYLCAEPAPITHKADPLGIRRFPKRSVVLWTTWSGVFLYMWLG